MASAAVGGGALERGLAQIQSTRRGTSPPARSLKGCIELAGRGLWGGPCDNELADESRGLLTEALIVCGLPGTKRRAEWHRIERRVTQTCDSCSVELF